MTPHPSAAYLARQYGLPAPPESWIMHYASNGGWRGPIALARPWHEWQAPPPELAPPKGLRLLGVVRSERGRVRLGLVGPAVGDSARDPALHRP